MLDNEEFFNSKIFLSKKLIMNNNPSEEEIINQAIKLHLQGKISEASKNYKYLIDQGLNEQRVFLILQQFYKVSAN